MPEFGRGVKLETVGEGIIAQLGQESGVRLPDGRWVVAEGGLKMMITRPETVLGVYKHRLDGRECFILGSTELLESGELGVVLTLTKLKTGEWITSLLPVLSGLFSRYVRYDGLFCYLDSSFLNEDDGDDWQAQKIDAKLARQIKPVGSRGRAWFRRLISVRV